MKERTMMKILCDSASDLSLSYIEENNIHLFPLTISIGEDEYRDIFEITTDKIYDSILAGIRPKTSQVSLSEFVDQFSAMAKAGESGIYISLSSKLSGTHQTALLAYRAVKEDYPDFDLRIVDSKSGSIGTGVIVIEAVDYLQAGKDLDTIENRLLFMADNLVTLFTITDLNYLAEGGRISKTSASIGSLLQINPVLVLVDGAVEVAEKIRGKKRVVKRILDILDEEADQLSLQTVGIAYSNDLESKEKLEAAIADKFSPKAIVARPVGATIGSHTGLGTLGVTFLKKYS